MEHPRIADAVRGLRHVFLRDMVLPARIGVHPHEQAGAAARAHQRRSRRWTTRSAGRDRRRHGRAVARPRVGHGDELSRVVDYERLPTPCGPSSAAGHVRLVETLAERIAEACLADPRVAWRGCGSRSWTFSRTRQAPGSRWSAAGGKFVHLPA